MNSYFENKMIKPMLFFNQMAPFDSHDYYYEVKFEGIRCIAYLDNNSSDIRNINNKRLLPMVPELNHLHCQVNVKCVLDGELVVIRNGMPDYFEIQRRLFLNDPFSIKLAEKNYPASFIAYDILQYGNKKILNLPLLERKYLLSAVIRSCRELTVARYIENNGIKLCTIAQAKHMDGIIAKHKQSLYFPNNRTSDWIKCSFKACSFH